MPRAIRPRTSVRPVLAALLALLAAVAGAAVPGAVTAVGAQEVVDRLSLTTLAVAPAHRSAVGVPLTVTVTVVDDTDEPVVDEPVHLVVEGDVVAVLTLDAAGRAETTATLDQGAHQIVAIYYGRDDLVGSSDVRVHSVLPDVCPDEARPGAGADVRHAYLVALHRCPDPAGYSYWVDRLEGGTRPAVVASTLARSAEAVDVVVDDAYRRVLGRSADPAGRRIWAAKLRSGWATSQLWAALAASPEFAAGTDGPAALVARAFDRIVDRPADPAGAAYWQDRLAGGPPSATWRALAVTAEVVDGIVADAHQSALGRAPSPSEAGAARATIRSRRGDWRLLVAELLGRPEARDHAQRYPDPVAAA